MFLVISASILAVIFVYLKVIKLYSYWSDKGVKQRKQTYLLGDNAGIIMRRETLWDLVQDLYKAFPDERYSGMYQMIVPTLVVRDPDLIKQITVKDFDHFLDHRTLIPDEIDDLWSRNLVALKGNRWRDMRSTVSPTFTTSKMKLIFNLISDCAMEFNRYFLDSTDDVVQLELKDTCTRYTNDIIATVAFGIKCDSLRERENEFYVMGKELTNFTGFWKILKLLSFALIPTLSKLLRMPFISKEIGEFFKRIVKENIALREEKGMVRQDVLQLLIEAKNGRARQEEENGKIIDAGFATVEESSHIASSSKIVRQTLTDIDITAQALIFFFAGFETISTLLCFLGHELSVNPDIQQRLQKEIDETLEECNGNLSYEALLKMKYMDMIVSEALRKWPVAVRTDRVCTKPYTIQPTRPNEKPIHLEVGSVLWIPIGGLHRDPKYFPEPERFDPERFSDENKDKIKPYTYLPFGSGPRNCIGSRFALIEAKTILFHLMSKFDLVPTAKTEVPIKLSKKSLTMTSENGFWVGLKLRRTN